MCCLFKIRSMVSFEGHRRSSAEHALFRQSDADEPGNEDFDDCFHHPEKKRRLTTSQVKFLEKSFEVENKLEPERKIQIARDVGLQPRQVAVWFQNRRARWKTKQLERDYEALKTSYDHLRGDHENLVREKEKLSQEVQVLREQLVQKGAEDPRHPNDVALADRKLQGPDLDFSVEEKEASELLVFGCRDEDFCSAISIVFDPETPEGGRYLATDPGCFPELGESNPCGFEVPVGADHALWPWPC